MTADTRYQSEIQISLLAGFCGGVLGVSAVLAGAKFDIPGFNIRSGFWGTNFLGSFLYALGNDAVALTIVAAIWFFYGAMIAGSLGLVVRILLRMAGINDK